MQYDQSCQLTQVPHRPGWRPRERGAKNHDWLRAKMDRIHAARLVKPLRMLLGAIKLTYPLLSSLGTRMGREIGPCFLIRILLI
jgi:hypothetical protein